MLLTTDYVLPTVLTGYVRSALADFHDNQFTLSQFLPNRVVDDLEYRLAAGGAGLARAGKFRAYDAESPVGKRQGIKRITGELPPLSEKVRLGEYDRLRLRKVTDQAIRDAILDDAREVARALAARMELARGDALFNGSVTINENGFDGITVDFQRDADMVVTAGTLWDASGDVFSDLETWRQAYVDQNGAEPGAILMSRKVLSIIRRNSTVRNIIWPSSSTQPTIVSQDQINTALESFGLPPIVIYNAKVNVDGTDTNVIPQNKIALLPAPVASDDYEGTKLGGTFWGTTAESLEPGWGIAPEDAPGMVAGNYATEDPVALWTKAAAIGLPAMANPDLAMVATVAS